MTKPLLIVTLIAILLTSVWSGSGFFDSGDPVYRLRVAHQLWTQGRLTIASQGTDHSEPLFKDATGTFRSKYGIGQSLFFVPFDIFATTLCHHLPFSGLRRDKVQSIILSISVAFVVLFGNFWMCFRLGRALDVDGYTSYMLAILAIFGSSFWQMVKQGQEEVQLSFLLMAAVYSFLLWRQDRNLPHLLCSAFASAAALLIRVTTLPIYVGVFALYLFELRKPGVSISEKRKVCGWFVASFLLGLASTAAYNLFKTGSPIRTGYEAEYAMSSNWVAGLVLPVVGIDRGIIMTNPWLIPFVIACVLGWRAANAQTKELVTLTAFLLLCSLVGYCRWWTWAGDFTYGARFQVHLIPIMCVTLGAVATKLAHKHLEKRKRLLAYMPLVCCVVVTSCFLQIPSICFKYWLEIAQAAAVNGDPARPGFTLTSSLGNGQVLTRYLNFASKVTTGHVIQVPLSHPESISAESVQQLSRWNFWPWLSGGRLNEKDVDRTRMVWLGALIMSLLAWAQAMRLAVSTYSYRDP